MTAEHRPGVFGRLAAAVLRHQGRTLVACLIVTVLSALAALRLSVDPDILDLLPPDDPTTRAIATLNEEEGGSGLLTIAVQGGEEQARRAWTRELAAALQADPDVDWVLYELDEDLAWRLGMLQLTPAELSQLHAKLQGAIQMGPAAQNPLLASRLLALGPLTEKLDDSGAAQVLSGQEGVERILVRPSGSAMDPTFARPFMGRVHDTLDQAQPAPEGVEVAWIGGPYRHAVEDLEAVLHDLTATLGVSLSVVLLFMAAAFKRPRAVLLILGPLIAANIWTLGLAGLVVGRLNTFTSYFTAVLIGLGVDFGIHLYARFREERTHTPNPTMAVIRAWDRTGPPSLTAAVTSAAGFASLWIAGFEGFRQLGTLLASGILLCLLAELLLLPILLVRFDPGVAQDHTPPVVQRPGPLPYRFAPLGLLAALALVALAASRLPQVEFQFDISELRSEGKSWAELDDSQRNFARNSYAPLIVSLPDHATLVAEHRRLQDLIEADQAPMIKGLLSVVTVLPDDQPQRVSKLQEIATLARQGDLRYLPPPVQQNLARIRQSDPAVLASTDLPLSIQQLLGAHDGHHRLVLMPDGNMWDIRQMVELRRSVNELLPGQVPASEYLATALLYDLMLRDAPRIAGLALVLVFIASWLDLRSLTRAVVAMGALLSGMAMTGAAMAIFDVKLSMANFVGVPILMGIGIDVVIHLLHRIEEEGPGGITRALRTTGWAAIMSALTTVISFASLTLADSRGVQGLGELIVVGLGMVVLAAFVLIPLGWMIVWRNEPQPATLRPEAPSGSSSQ